MSNTNDSFENELEQLIRLFKKIKDKTKAAQFSHLDPAFAQNLDFIITNYEMVKNNFPKEMFTQMGLPFQQMMREFINHLKTELGDEFDEDEMMVQKLENENAGAEVVTPEIIEAERKERENPIGFIDEQLKKPGLSEDAINKLLDKRNALLNS